jgi:hypothetical protein
MTPNSDVICTFSMEEMLDQASTRAGLSAAHMLALLDCEMEIEHLLAYITAVTSNRMN